MSKSLQRARCQGRENLLKSRTTEIVVKQTLTSLLMAQLGGRGQSTTNSYCYSDCLLNMMVPE